MVPQLGKETAIHHVSKSPEHNILTDEQVSQHKTEGDAWLVVDGKVYDVTSFLESHPGGQGLILKHLHVRDAGDLLRGNMEVEEGLHTHSLAAFRMLAQYLVGSLSSSAVTKERSVNNVGKAKTVKYVVDFTKPIVPQVGYLGSDYDEWVHDPIVRKETPRFFANDIAEYFTRTKWWVIPMVWCPVCLGMYHAAMQNGMTRARIPPMITAGVVFWTILEYMLHRYLFHMKTSSFWGNTCHYVLHGFHHKHPMDSSRLVMPPVMAAPILLVIWVLLGDWLFCYADKLVMYGSMILSYVCYDLTHYFLHFGTPFNSQVRHMRSYHMNHHFKDQNKGYGVTSTFWDWVFRTLPGYLMKPSSSSQ